MKIYLIRHGQSKANETRTIAGQNATPLTDIGKMQARTLGEKISEMRVTFDSVYSSDLQRASETTSIICNELGISEIAYDIRLREGDAGIFTGKCVDDFTSDEKALFDSLLVDIDSRIQGGESVNEQMIRTKEVFLEIVKKHPEDSIILIVGHGGTLYHILKNTLNILPERDEWFGNCKLNIIERSSHQCEWKLTMLDNIQVDA